MANAFEALETEDVQLSDKDHSLPGYHENLLLATNVHEEELPQSTLAIVAPTGAVNTKTKTIDDATQEDGSQEDSMPPLEEPGDIISSDEEEVTGSASQSSNMDVAQQKLAEINVSSNQHSISAVIPTNDDSEP